MVRSTFCTGRGQVARTPDSNWRYHRGRGGGSVYDLGCYTIHHARWVFRAEPLSVFASARRGIEVDDGTHIQMLFPGGRVAQVSAAFDTSSSQEFEIMGTTGILRSELVWNNENRPVALECVTRGLTERFHFEPVHQFQLQLEHLCEVLDGSAEPRIPAQNSVDQMRVIDAVYESIASGSVVTL